jgi:hypothetical protein
MPLVSAACAHIVHAQQQRPILKRARGKGVVDLKTSSCPAIMFAGGWSSLAPVRRTGPRRSVAGSLCGEPAGSAEVWVGVLVRAQPIIFLRVFENRLADELPSTLEVQPQRLLERDPEEPESLQLPSALQRTGVYSSQAPIAGCPSRAKLA